MCGIVGIALSNIGSAKGDLISSLKRLEYRGYDSCGYALSTGSLKKGVGKISEFLSINDDEFFRTGICHTRWSTHGPSAYANAHPHSNKNGDLFAVHNGIIDNYQELRYMLELEGYVFKSATDTEVIPHYFDWKLKNGTTMEHAIQSFFKDVQGTYAILLLQKGENKIFALKKDSPLVLGIGDDGMYIASDIYAFVNKTNKAVFLEDNQYVSLSANDFSIFNENGVHVEPTIVNVEGEDECSMDDFDHYTIKEIHDQPAAAKRILQSLATEQNAKVEAFANMMNGASKIIFVACGTSYHASLIGGSALSRMGYDVHNVIASEFDTFYKVKEDTLIVPISQSGETMDVVTVVKEAKKRGAKVASLVNVPFSTIQRESDVSIDIRAGQEVAVASTKAFTNQVLVLLHVAKTLNPDLELNLDVIPDRIQETIDYCEENVPELAERLASHEHAFFLGRSAQYPVAREMALKLKEVTYIHAEGLPASELKHGSIALIDPNVGTPVICLIPNNDLHMLSSMREVEARGAWSIPLVDSSSRLNQDKMVVPSSNGIDFALYATVFGQMLAYYTAIERGCDVDQPRNLAKSVTVH